jgi:hypothetical protein
VRDSSCDEVVEDVDVDGEVEATELLWPVVSADCCVLLVLAVDELLLELGGVDERSAYVPLVPCAVLDGLVEAVVLL